MPEDGWGLIMKKRKSKLIALIIVMILGIGMFSGCGKSKPNDILSSNEETVSDIQEILDVDDSKDLSNDSIGEQGEHIEEDIAEEPHALDNFVLYFSGIDVWGWTDTKSRSDVNIIAVVNTNTRNIQLINTPRDYYVELPISNGAKDKLTHAGLYGVENSMGALEMLYGIDIDYYLRMNFSGFEKIIDTMGGIDVYSEYEFTVDPIKHYEQGYNHLTGLEALAFVRERHAFAAGDNQRGKNQMALVQAMVKKVCSIDFLNNYEVILDELTDMYRTNMDADLVASLVINQLLNDSEWTVSTFSVTGTGGSEATYSAPNSVGYVMYPNMEDVAKATELMNSVLNETN